MNFEQKKDTAKKLIQYYLLKPNQHQKIIALIEKFELQDFTKHLCKRYSMQYEYLFKRKTCCTITTKEQIEKAILYKQIMVD